MRYKDDSWISSLDDWEGAGAPVEMEDLGTRSGLGYNNQSGFRQVKCGRLRDT